MDDFVQFGGRQYGMLFVLLFVSRGMDVISTWLATPNLVLEGNPVAKLLGWRWGLPVNLAFCFGFAFWPFTAIVISTISVLVASRNFQSAWLMRSLGEAGYREWHRERIQETSVTFYLGCLFAQTALIAGVGVALAFFAGNERAMIPMAIGVGIVGYALAVVMFSLLGIWRMRRMALREKRFARIQPVPHLEPVGVQLQHASALWPAEDAASQGK
jgi:hypothetical protein